MSTAHPPHYTAFRIALVAVMVLVLAAAVWAVGDPAVLASLYRYLGLE
jgi:hypothetical protein